MAHARVEDTLDLLDPALTTDRLAAVVAHLHAFWAVTEPAVDAWASTRPELAARLEWPRRRRTADYADDLRALGAGPVASPAPVFDEVDDAAALGWLYVAEGSTLGGAVIERRLAPLLAAADLRLRSFSPYAEGPGPMWLRYGEVLDEWVAGDAARVETVAQRASAVFTALDEWVAPLRTGAAA